MIRSHGRIRNGRGGDGILSMNVATIPPGGVASAHIHVDFEVMLYILAGRVRHEYGPALEHALENIVSFTRPPKP